jgi:hypothetical protein
LLGRLRRELVAAYGPFMEITNTQDDEANVAYREFMARVSRARTCAGVALLLAAGGLGWAFLSAGLHSLSGGLSASDAAFTLLQASFAWVPAVLLIVAAQKSFLATDEEYAAQAPELGTALTSAKTMINFAVWGLLISFLLGALPMGQAGQDGGVSSY